MKRREGTDIVAYTRYEGGWSKKSGKKTGKKAAKKTGKKGAKKTGKKTRVKLERINQKNIKILYI